MSETLQILCVGHEAEDVALVVDKLSRFGYSPGTRLIHSFSNFELEIKSGDWDLILSELHTDDYDYLAGISFLRQIDPSTPFIVYTDTELNEESILTGLNAGVSDFIPKKHINRLAQTIQRELREVERERERSRAVDVRDALLQFSQVASTTRSLSELYAIIHSTVSSLMPADNFYIALYDEVSDLLSFPYYVDQFDVAPEPQKPGQGLTEYILRAGVSVFASPELFEDLVENNEVELIGSPSIDWIGVPLRLDGKVIGVIAVQSYAEGVRYRKEDLDILTFASDQIAMAINRTRGEQELLEEITFRKAIERSILAGIFVFDLQGRQTYVNPAFCSMIGWSADELLGMTPPYLYWPPEEISNITDVFRITTGENALPSDFELRFQRKNGDRFDAYLMVSPLRDEQQRLTGWLASIYDISERKFTEELLRQQTQRAEAMARMAGRLNTRLDQRAVLDTVCEETVKALNASAAAVLLYDPDTELYQMEASVGFPADFVDQFTPVSKVDYFIEKGSTELLLSTFDMRGPVKFPHANLLLSNNIRTIAAVKMTRDDRVTGEIAVFSIGKERQFTHEEISLLRGLADLAEQSIVNARLFEETERRLEQVRALRTIDLAIRASLDIKVTLNILLDHVILLLNVDAADILLYNPNSKQLEYAVARGLPEGVHLTSRQRLLDGYAGQVLISRNPLYIQNLSTQPDQLRSEILRGDGFSSYVGTPLIAKGEIKGVLELYHADSPVRNREWQELLDALAGQAAIAIDNASMFQQLQKSNEELTLAYDSTLEGWVRALSLKDMASEAQTHKVVDLTIRLARRMGVRDDELIHIQRGALLHDVGKIGVSDQIINKPGPLTEDEWIGVKKHPEYAYQILYPIAYLRPALDIPYCHHEKWDGSGYPRGLRGEEIPIAARIFSVVDEWESLRSDRAYRSAMTDDEVIAYIKSQAGTRFDPVVVDSFLRLIQ